jgi:hypothetical protein
MAPIVLAAITFGQILEILALAIVLHVILLAPVVVAVVRAWLEFQDNQRIRRARGAGRSLNAAS